MHKKKEKKRKGRRDKRNCRFTKGALIRFLGADHQSLEAPLPMTFIQLACWFNKQTNPYRLSDQISTLKTFWDNFTNSESDSVVPHLLSLHIFCVSELHAAKTRLSLVFWVQSCHLPSRASAAWLLVYHMQDSVLCAHTQRARTKLPIKKWGVQNFLHLNVHKCTKLFQIPILASTHINSRDK